MTDAPPIAPGTPENTGAPARGGDPATRRIGRILLVGNPNVGKSALFNRLTGRYATVSNYPGTTVEVYRGGCASGGFDFEVIDTPGMYSLLPITEEERVARDILFAEKPQAVISVVDTKNIRRMLGLTLQLIEAGLPVIVALNMHDEARSLGIRVDTVRLQAMLGVPVVPTVSITGEGVDRIIALLPEAQTREEKLIDYGVTVEHALAALEPQLQDSDAIRPRAHALLLLQGDREEKERLLRLGEGCRAGRTLQAVSRVAASLEHSPHYEITLATNNASDRIVSAVVTFPAGRREGLKEALDRVIMNPWTGFPILFLVLYLGLYKFVGGVGAGVLVRFLEESVFGRYVNPWSVHAAGVLLPWQSLRDLVAGDYGIITLGIRYAVAIVLPIVGTFFLFFSILEDTGYLPRLAMLVDRAFKKVGLSGRAIIPIVLGFGCDTMATIVTRTLETKRERLICTILLALAIPCSAQLGVILGLLAGHPGGLAVWIGVLTVVFLTVGFLTSRFLPGEPAAFYMELPPLRIPYPGNVLVKTYSRMVWYFKEVLPLFILASVIIWLGQITGIFPLLIRGLEPVVHLLGLPARAAVAVLFGFFRRDYGVAGLYDLHNEGLLTGNQLTVAAITLTLFLPCIAQLLVMAKERGARTAFLVSVAVAVIAIGTGFVTNAALTAMGISL